jgi:hypothetical protein
VDPLERVGKVGGADGGRVHGSRGSW